MSLFEISKVTTSIKSSVDFTLNTSVARAASLLVRLVEGTERWETTDHRVLPQNWGGTEKNRTVTGMGLNSKANDRHKNLALRRDEFRGLCSNVAVDQVA
ncbi:hypothetical protein TNCV_4584711 [Trichonephila clavipes]|nr:hypothetical protein TNCV_4584711 [Trichonephila clavipes]